MKKQTVLFILLLACFACKRPESDVATVSIQIPSVQQMAAANKNSAMATTVDYSRLCLAVNVKGQGVDSIKDASTCMIERVQMSSAVSPGQNLEIMVTGGTDRTFEVYGFLRNSATDACPAVDSDKGWGSFPVSKVYFLGSKGGVNIVPPSAEVTIPITLPADTMNIAVVRSWPAVCNGNSTVATSHFGQTLLGAKDLSSTSFKLRAHISGRQREAAMSSTSFRFKGGAQ